MKIQFISSVLGWILRVIVLFGMIQYSRASSLSALTNGVYLAVGGWRGSGGPVTNEPFRISDELVFLPFCNTGKVELAYPLDPKYLVRFRMTDSTGKEIAKTALGKKYGFEFDKLPDYKEIRTGVVFAWGAFESNLALGGGKSLPKPEDLFHVKTIGTYTLEIEMQMFQFATRGTNEWERESFRFSPVKVQVEKRPDS